MGFFGKLLGAAAPIVGGLLGGPAGAGIGGALGSAIGGQEQASSAQEAASTAFDRNQAAAAEQRAWASQEAATARDFNALQSQKQMDFQERMANSAHQREVADLRAAGLNPILSGTGGMGSATPVGSSAHASAPSGSAASASMAQAYDVVTPAISTAMNVANSLAQRDLIEAQTRNTEKTTSKMDYEIDVLKMEPAHITAKTASLTSQSEYQEALRWKTEKEKELMDKQISELASRIALQSKQAGLAVAQADSSSAQAGKLREETAGLETDKFFRKRVLDLTQDDLKGPLSSVPVEVVQGLIMMLFKK